MVSGCLNPECRKEFRLLGGGDLYAYERTAAPTEFFWLCGECSRGQEAYVDADGKVRVRPRAAAGHAFRPHPAGQLRMVAGPSLRTPWHSVPAGERHSCWMSDRREANGPRRGWG